MPTRLSRTDTHLVAVLRLLMLSLYAADSSDSSNRLTERYQDVKTSRTLWNWEFVKVIGTNSDYERFINELIHLGNKHSISWSRVLIQKLTVTQLIKKFYALYVNRRFITVFTTARHLSLSWARCFQSTTPSHLISLRSILISFSHLRLCLPGGLFP
jgi:hypothetical protein